MKRLTHLSGRGRRAAIAMLVAVGASTAVCITASPTLAADLAQAPLRFLQTSPVKPNLLFILDDSGSMQWSFLGDEVVAHNYENTVGYRSSVCNKIYYDPAVVYPVPVRADGSTYPAANFHAAPYDGFRADSPKIDLSRDFMAWRSFASVPPTPAGYLSDCWHPLSQCTPAPAGVPNLPGAAHYFVYEGEAAAKLGDNTRDDPCKEVAYSSAAGGGTRWRRVEVGAGSGPGGSDERQNFANWFSYHRTRMLTMKTAVGRAFGQLDGNYRVGFSLTSDPGVGASPAGFLRIREFSGQHRRNFYDTLYGVAPISSTPLRAALAKAGQLYAGQLLTGSDDPVQFSCQRNFTLLSTDGYWNATAESGSFGPKQVDGRTDVGNADRRLPRPMADGSRGARPYRLATLTVATDHRRPPGSYNGIENIYVNGLRLMDRGRYLQLVEGTDRTAYARALANAIAERIKENGFRALPEENRVYLLAPDSADHLEQLPRITHLPELDPGSESILSVTPFSAVAGALPHTNTLADVAAYYFETDLRSPALNNCGPDRTLCDDNVPVVPGQRGGRHQHMVTYTLGLGALGTLGYREDYETAPDGDFRDIVNGKRDWPDPIFSLGPERIDDLWHAAVNGGGRYFSARSPASLARALAGTLEAIRASTAAAAATATSSEEPAQHDNQLFASRYRSLYWDGELEARRIDVADGSLSGAPDWSAAAQLSRRVGSEADTRRIYLASGAASDGLKAFDWGELDRDERALFNGLCPGTEGRRFSHCTRLSDAQQRLASGIRLVNYLRGHSGHEERPGQVQPLFRKREQVLGAPINAQPLFVGPAAFRYADPYYGEFRDEVAARRPGTVYLAANDGMLHAFDAATGDERWAFIPTGVLPELWRSADPAFATGFRYLLDGTPVAGDICPSAPAATCAADAWRTLLVGGLGAAGREYYALDITDPEKPRYLWRFSVDDDRDLGHAVGKPLITKRRDGRWVVVITSGYDNVNPGSGRGVLYVLNAATGELLSRIDTGEGSESAPAGLAQLNAWVDNLLDNTAERLYAGDLQGRVWRFDINDPLPDNVSAAVLFARLERDGVPQPVTTRPALSVARVGGASIPLVSVATGRYLNLADADDDAVQSLYTLKDPLTASSLGDVRRLSSMVRQQLREAGSDGQRRLMREPVDWSVASGWYVDFDVRAGSGERVNLDLVQQPGVLRVVTNVPDQRPCQPQSEAWAYAFDALEGSHLPIAADAVVGRRVSRASMIAGTRQLRLGKQVVQVLTDEAGNVSSLAEPLASGVTRPPRRVSWRELDVQ